MSLFDSVTKLKMPNSKKVMDIPNDIKTSAKQKDLNTVDIIYFNNDWDYCILTNGIKKRLTSVPQIDLKIPEKLTVWTEENSSAYNKTTQRELYLVNEKSPYAINLNSIPVKSAYTKVEKSLDEIVDVEITQKMLNTLGSVRLIDDIDEKGDNGYPIIFIFGMFAGAFIMSIILAYLYS